MADTPDPTATDGGDHELLPPRVAHGVEPHVEEKNAKPPSRKRLIITAVLGLVVMIGVFVLLIPQFGDYENAILQLKDMPLGWIIALVVAGILNLVLYPYTVLVSVEGLRYWHGQVERQVGFLVSNAIPGGGAFAVGAQYKVLSLYKVPPPLAASAVSADAVWTFLLTLGMPAFAVLLLVFEGDSNTQLTTIAVLGMIAFAVLLALSIVTIRSEAGARRVGRRLELIVGAIARKFKKDAPGLEQALVNFQAQAHDLVTRRWFHLSVANLVAQLTPFLVLLMALGGLGEWPGTPLKTAQIFAAYAVALLLVSVPLTPGGLGTVDAALIGLLIAFGASNDDAVAADLLWRLVWFLPQMIFGAITMVIYLIGQNRQTRAALAQAPATP